MCVGSNSFQPPFFFSDEYAVAKIVFHDFIFLSYIAGSFPFGGSVFTHPPSLVVIFSFISDF